MRKRFDLQDWLKDKSQKVETRCGFPARIICCDRAVKEGQPTELKLCVLVQEDGGETVYLYYSDGTKWAKDENYDLFIVTLEEELTEFEYALYQVLMECPYPEEYEEWYPFLKEKVAELLSLALEQLQPDIDSLKNLPRWKKAKEYMKLGPNDFVFTLDSDGKCSPYWDTEVEEGQFYITESDIENLPKED